LGINAGMVIERKRSHRISRLTKDDQPNSILLCNEVV